ncbi:MAG: hypothetical protein M3P27_02440 [Acidobacteriota bacterium]|nr:hypothetical protein [Acidobacteriota bacterium]
MRWIGVTVVCMLLLCVLGNGQSPAAPTPQSPQSPQSIQLMEAARTEVSIPFAQSDTAAAYLIEPKGIEKRPAVLYLHWLGAPNGDKREFLTEATEVAKHGVIVLLIDLAWSRPGWFKERKLKDDPAMSRLEVQRIEAALRFLAKRANVDRTRIAIVGHDFGGMYALLALKEHPQATDDPPIKGLISVASTPRMSDWFLYGQKLSAAEELEYLKTMAELDPIRSARSSTVPALFQFAKCDEFISQVSAAELKRAYKGESEVRWYAGGHELHSAEAIRDRVQWLTKILQVQRQ